jgi:hypothetical protein
MTIDFLCAPGEYFFASLRELFLKSSRKVRREKNKSKGR